MESPILDYIMNTIMAIRIPTEVSLTEEKYLFGSDR